MIDVNRPPVVARGEEKVYFDHLREHELIFQRCTGCSHAVFPLRTVCPQCQSESLNFERSAGQGTVYSFTTQYRASHPFFTAEVPITLVLVDLDEGVRVFANLIESVPDDARIGMRVEAVFDDVEPELTLVRFRPAPIEAQS